MIPSTTAAARRCATVPRTRGDDLLYRIAAPRQQRDGAGCVACCVHGWYRRCLLRFFGKLALLKLNAVVAFVWLGVLVLGIPDFKGNPLWKCLAGAQPREVLAEDAHLRQR